MLYKSFIIIILYMFQATVPIIRSNYINTASGMVRSVSDRPVCTPDGHLQMLY